MKAPKKIIKSFNLHYSKSKPVQFPMTSEDYSPYAEKATPQQIHLSYLEGKTFWFLGIEVHQDRVQTLIWLSQSSYIGKIVQAGEAILRSPWRQKLM